MQIRYQRIHQLISKFFTFWIGAEAGAGAEVATKSNGPGSASRGSKKGGSGSTTPISTMYSVHWWDLMKKSAENPVKSRIKIYHFQNFFAARPWGGSPPHTPPPLGLRPNLAPLPNKMSSSAPAYNWCVVNCKNATKMVFFVCQILLFYFM